MTDLAIHTQGLGKRFGERAALEHIDLEVPRGCAFGFLGPNGAGKTTLIRLLLGLAKPTSGTIRLLGKDDRSQALARVGAIVEEPRFHRHLTGRENLHVHAAARDKSAHGRVDAALERVGLGRRADDKVGTYSLGMRQRLGVARCLLCDPELLILDEPVNGLDPAGILEFRNLIRELVAEGRTVLLSSHLLDEVEKTCDVAAIVDNGRVIAQGPIADLVSTQTREIDIDAAPRVRAAGPAGLGAQRGPRRRAQRRHPRDALARGARRPRDRHRDARPAAGRRHRGRARGAGHHVARGPVPDHDHPPGGPSMRLIRAEVLKLRRRNGMVAMTAILTFVAVAVYYAIQAIRGDADGHFNDAIAVLAMAGSVAGAIVGATAGAADIEAGVFRDLVATGRSRLALFFARVPGAWAIVLPMLALGVALAAVLDTPTSDDIVAGAGQVLISGALTAAVCVGLAALTGSRGTVIGLALAFQLGISPILAQVEAIGDFRYGIPSVAIARIGGGELEFALATAFAIVLAWAAAALAAGAWRSATQEI